MKNELIEELWYDVPGYKNLYQISNLQRVRSYPRLGKTRLIGGKILNPYMFPNGYWAVTFCHKRKYKTAYIHRLMAEVFLPNPNNYPIVNHKDSNPSNNNIENLEWCTQSYNVKYGFTNNGRVQKGGRKTKFKINQYDLNMNFIRNWDSVKQICQELFLDQASISKCCNGKLKTVGGFIWKYED